MDNPEGLHLEVRFGEGWARTTVILGERKAGWPGLAHDGIVTTLLDEVMCYAVGPQVKVVTAELTVRYLAPVPVGRPITARAQCSMRRGRLRVAHGVIEDLDGTPLARADAKFLRVRHPDGVPPEGSA